MIGKIRDILLSHGIAESKAREICLEISRTLGSGRHYIARSDFTERNREIMAGFRGNNYAALADAFGVSPRQVRRIVKK